MKALLLAPFSPSALERLRSQVEVTYESWLDSRRLLSPKELVQRLQGVTILIVEADFIFDEVFAGAGDLKFLGVCRGTVTNVDVEAATRHGVLVVNTPARNAVAVAELTIGLMLALARHIPRAHGMVSTGRWSDPISPYTELRGIELGGKAVGLIGLGAIGREVAYRLRAFHMKILAYDPHLPPEAIVAQGAQPAPLETLLAEADFVSLHCPVSPETAGLIDAPKISLMKPTAYLVNTAGAELVDESALAQALAQGRLAGAALDVHPSHPIPPHSPFLGLDNVILTPHIGGATADTIDRYSHRLVEDIERFLRRERPHNLLNPEVWPDA
ncbi:MAG TPA: hypothetical protein G4O03_08875 [Dehalococcoidia bacterium]|nr:hypothetical protein [Dehalococcoidia bacterium]